MNDIAIIADEVRFLKLIGLLNFFESWKKTTVTHVYFCHLSLLGMKFYQVLSLLVRTTCRQTCGKVILGNSTGWIDYFTIRSLQILDLKE